ncbi:hypothetical protein LVY75_35530 (plasmid) [Sinorhizobium sp. B11]|jgi:hypothetical protein
MGDIDRSSTLQPAAPIARKCHCGDWAGFGYAKGERQDWWCWKHYPYKTSARLEAAEIADMLADRVA